MTLTFGSLFSGIGGMDLGLERAGWECMFQVEIDDYCRRVLAKHWPDVPKYGDIREVTGDELGRVDLIAGGFPCQPVSLAGRRRAQFDDRWLWPEFARLIRVLRPAYVLIENVPGLITAGLGLVLSDLAALGFDAEWSVLSACTLGFPHTRERLFIVAYPQVSGTRNGRWVECPQERDSQRDIYLWPNRPEPNRVADGIPRRVDRLRGLGNAVVPQCAEWIGRRLAVVAGDEQEGQP